MIFIFSKILNGINWCLSFVRVLRAIELNLCAVCNMCCVVHNMNVLGFLYEK